MIEPPAVSVFEVVVVAAAAAAVCRNLPTLETLGIATKFDYYYLTDPAIVRVVDVCRTLHNHNQDVSFRSHYL